MNVVQEISKNPKFYAERYKRLAKLSSPELVDSRNQIIYISSIRSLTNSELIRLFFIEKALKSRDLISEFTYEKFSMYRNGSSGFRSRMTKVIHTN